MGEKGKAVQGPSAGRRFLELIFMLFSAFLVLFSWSSAKEVPGTHAPRFSAHFLSIFGEMQALSPVLRIRDVYPGSRIRIFSIPDPHQRI
jgi:hypothetical protein